MKPIKILFLLVALCSIIDNIQAQNLSTDLKKMHDTYLHAESIQMEMDVTVHEFGSVVMTKKASIKKSANNYLYTLDDVTMLVNKDYILMVNEAEKVVVFNTIEDEQQSEGLKLDPLMIHDIDSLLTNFSSWKFNDDQKGIRHYTIYTEGQQMSRIELYLNAENHFTIHRMVYHYDEEKSSNENKVETKFKRVAINSKIKPETFSEQQFIKKDKKGWITTSSYEEFELIQATTN